MLFNPPPSSISIRCYRINIGSLSRPMRLRYLASRRPNKSMDTEYLAIEDQID